MVHSHGSQSRSRLEDADIENCLWQQIWVMNQIYYWESCLSVWEQDYNYVRAMRWILWVYSLLQHLLPATHFEQVAGEVNLVQVIVDPAECLTDQQFHWRIYWRRRWRRRWTCSPWRGKEKIDRREWKAVQKHHHHHARPTRGNRTTIMGSGLFIDLLLNVLPWLNGSCLTHVNTVNSCVQRRDRIRGV